MYNECRHVMPSGARCHSPAMRGMLYCYFHYNLRRAAAPKCGPFDTLQMPLLEDTCGIQLALAEVLGALVSSRLDPKRAGLLLYGLQIAAQLTARAANGSGRESVKDPCYGTSGETLAPEKTVCEPVEDCRACPNKKNCDQYAEYRKEMDEKEAHQSRCSDRGDEGEPDKRDEDATDAAASSGILLEKLSGCEEDHDAAHDGQDQAVQPQLAQACPRRMTPRRIWM